MDSADYSLLPKPQLNSETGTLKGVIIHKPGIEIEKMTLDDGMGNKAKLSRLKDGGIKVECTSSNIL